MLYFYTIMKTEQTNVRLPENVKTGLRYLALKRKTTFSKLVVKILENYYEDHKKEAMVSLS